jgi:hypothetical protein
MLGPKVRFAEPVVGIGVPLDTGKAHTHFLVLCLRVALAMSCQKQVDSRVNELQQPCAKLLDTR